MTGWPSSICPLKEVENKVWFETVNCSKILTSVVTVENFFHSVTELRDGENKNMQIHP